MNTASKINTRPQLIAFIACGQSPDKQGAISVYLFETAGDPFFRLVANGGELPEEYDRQYPTAKAAIKAAAELALCVIYDEVEEITETGEEDEDTAA